MKKFYEMGRYQQWIDLNTKKSSCTCTDFRFRQLKKDGPKIIQVGECKHLKQVKKWLSQKKKENS